MKRHKIRATNNNKEATHPPQHRFTQTLVIDKLIRISNWTSEHGHSFQLHYKSNNRIKREPVNYQQTVKFILKETKNEQTQTSTNKHKQQNTSRQPSIFKQSAEANEKAITRNK